MGCWSSRIDAIPAADVSKRRRLSLFDGAHPLQQLNLQAMHQEQGRRLSVGGGASSGTGQTDGQRACECEVWWGGYSRPGNDPMKKKRENQDCFLVEDCFCGDRDSMLFSVFDGHGPSGSLCASFIQKHLPLEYIARKTQLRDDATAAMIESSEAADVLLAASDIDGKLLVYILTS